MTDHPDVQAAGLTLRRAGRDDDAAIRALIARAYDANPKAQEAYTAWQWWDNPFGPTRSWVWARPDGQVVSHWAAVAVPVVLDGRRVIGAKGVDIATAPEWRGRRLFGALARRLLADCREAGVPVLLSHPNPASAKAVVAAGAHEVAQVPVWVRPLDDGWLARRLRLPRPVAAAARAAVFRTRAGPAAEEVDGPPVGLDALWQRVAPQVRCGIARDAAWWHWRYTCRPERPYRYWAVRDADGTGNGGGLRGAAVATVRPAFGGRFAQVLEWLAADDDAAAALGRALGRLDADGLAAMALPGSALARHARRSGLRRLPRALEPRPLRFCMAASDDAAADRLAGEVWEIAWGDLDHL